MDKPTLFGAIYGLTIVLMVGFLIGAVYLKSWWIFLIAALLFVIVLLFALRQSQELNNSSNNKYH